jgi:hypothetical protein
MYSFFFSLGIAGFAYTKMGRRVGYGNAQSVWMLVAIAFVVSLIFFYTLTTFVLHLQ